MPTTTFCCHVAQCRVSVIIAHIANTSVKAGRFPSAWKAGLMAPLLKKPGLDDNDFKSVGPVSSLSTLSKLLDHLALARLKPHVVTLPNYCDDRAGRIRIANVRQLRRSWRRGHKHRSDPPGRIRVCGAICGAVLASFVRRLAYPKSRSE